MTIDKDESLLDQPLQLRARHFLKLLRKEVIETRYRETVSKGEETVLRKILYQIELSIFPACLIMTSTMARSKRWSRSGRSGETRA